MSKVEGHQERNGEENIHLYKKIETQSSNLQSHKARRMRKNIPKPRESKANEGEKLMKFKKEKKIDIKPKKR